MNKFKKRTFAETLRLLMLDHPRIPKKHGKLVPYSAAPIIGTSQANVSRWLSEYSKDPIDSSEELLCGFFDVSRDQLIGKAPIPWIDKEAYEVGLVDPDSDLQQRIAEVVSDLSRQDKAMKEMFIENYLSAKKTYESMKKVLADEDIPGTFKRPDPKKQVERRKK